MPISRRQRERIVSRKIVEALIAGKSGNEIMRTLHVGKAKVTRAKKQAALAGYLDGTTPLPPFPEPLFPDVPDRRSLKTSDVDVALIEHVTWIEDRLNAGWHAISIFEELPIPVKKSSFYRFLERHGLGAKRKSHGRVVPEIIHKPGEALLVDWGKVANVICPVTGKNKIVWAFVGVLGFSRYMMVRFTLSQDTDTTLLLLESMFREIGGAPWRLTTDNPKCFSLNASRFEPLLNPIYERFAGYYDITVECLPPADPEKKGKVERPMPYVRRLLESFAGDWTNLAQAQDFMEHKLGIANQRLHGTTGEKPIERLINQELSALKSLPALAWQREEYHEGKVRKDGHIRFRGKYYSVDERLIGADLQIIANAHTVWIYQDGKLIETHGRVIDPHKSKSTKSEHLKPWERAMTETSVYRSRAQAIGPFVDEFVVRIIGNGLGMIDFRKVWGLLSLEKSYDADSINEACRIALEMDSVRLRTVWSLLKTKQKASPALYTEQNWPMPDHNDADQVRIHRFVRSISEYGALVASQQTKH